MLKQKITLYPDTFVWTNSQDGFIYNSKNFQKFHFVMSERLKRICSELMLPSNLYSAILMNSDMDDIEVKRWVHFITKDYNAGYLSTKENEKAISFKPMIKIFNDINTYIWENQRGSCGSIMHNLHELTFYINGTEFGNDTYFKQTIFPIKNGSQLATNSIISFINKSQNPFFIQYKFGWKYLFVPRL